MTNSTVVFEINSTADKWYARFHDIYKISFPIYEQRSHQQQISAFGSEHYKLKIWTKGDVLLSFISYWEFDSYIYIEHLAVNPEIRGKSIGSKTLNNFADSTGKVILLEIDPLKDEVARKRLSFYRNLDFKLNPFEHFHPAYNPEYPPHELLVLSLGRQLTDAEYNRFISDIDAIIMKE